MSVESTTKSLATPAIAGQDPIKPNDPVAVKKAVSLGKELGKRPEVTKADVARQMFQLISEESREVIVQAFVDGAGLTPKGAQTYFYNCRRKSAK